ncbi:RNA polymerase sigma factor [Herbiconiux sp. UC225_62]|uniref:RNA polymerase sigma factor n=1 Tax=Herbiconiux sp. UC225_62 TaxID=3350168 RepID=UPI0036D265A9
MRLSDAGGTRVTEAGAARARAELVARESYGRLLAVLAAPTRDVAGAEDALADAFERALRTWPESGVPDNPEAWLLTVARNRQRDDLGSAARRTTVPLDVLDPDDERGGSRGRSSDLAAASAASGHGRRVESGSVGDSAGAASLGSARSSTPLGDPSTIDYDAVPDKRLELLFVCAHPAIDPAVRTPLMLQTVLGFDAARIAQAFALPAPAMAQRLVRAKRRIRDAGIPFVVPERGAMDSRLPPVLEAVYGCYAIEWQRVSGETLRDSLAGEALYLATTLAELLPTEPEVHGLGALLCLSIARTDARTGSTGEHVPLAEQDTALWDTGLIARGESHLRRAHGLAMARPTPAGGEAPGFGRFQLEAAMQSVHCARAVTGETDWRTLRTLNEALVRVAPTLGAQVSLAATIAEVDGPEAGLAHLDALATSPDPDSPEAAAALARFQPAWATRAHLLAAAGRADEARAAYAKAISLTTDARLRAYLQAQTSQ